MFFATFSLPPSINRTYKTATVNGHATLYKSAEAKAWSEEVLWTTKNQTPLTGDCAVFLTYYFPTKSRDIDGSIKISMDTLQGIAFVNDRQVTILVVEKRIDKQHPRMEVEVRAVSGAPLPP